MFTRVGVLPVDLTPRPLIGRASVDKKKKTNKLTHYRPFCCSRTEQIDWTVGQQSRDQRLLVNQTLLVWVTQGEKSGCAKTNILFQRSDEGTPSSLTMMIVCMLFWPPLAIRYRVNKVIPTQ